MEGSNRHRAWKVFGALALLGLLVVVAAVARSRDAKRKTAHPAPVAIQHSPATATAATPRAPLVTGRHSQLTGARTEALCTSLSDVRQFYDASQDQTQDGLSCSLILAGRSSADVVVFESYGAYVRVRLSDNTGHYSDGYMRRQAVQ
jgi:hypothetical protein